MMDQVFISYVRPQPKEVIWEILLMEGLPLRDIITARTIPTYADRPVDTSKVLKRKCRPQ